MSSTKHFEFKGKGGDLFVIVLKNILFTLLTLGLYFPFAKTAVRKYFWNHLEVEGEKFQYTGNGWEILKGYLIVALGYILFIAYNALVAKLLPEAAVLTPFIIIATVVIFLPIIIVGSRAYLLSRTNLRGIRFAVDKKIVKKLRMYLLKGFFFSIITLGFYNIVLFLRVRSMIMNNTYYGDNKFEYKEEVSEYFWMNFRGIILTYVTFGIYSAWLTKDVLKYHANHTYLQGQNFEIDIEGSEVLLLYLKSIFLIIFTLGLATPWVATINMTFYINRLKYNGEFDYSKVRRCEFEQYGEISDGIGDTLDIDFGI